MACLASRDEIPDILTLFERTKTTTKTTSSTNCFVLDKMLI